MIPDGAEPFKSELNEKFVATFTLAGAYGIECTPHYAWGMVALVVVGDAPANLDAARAEIKPPMPRKAQERFGAIFAEFDAQ